MDAPTEGPPTRVPGDPHLSANACRALGSLLEKQVTVPATYPLTLNAVVAACNQTTGRDPVLSLSEAEAEAALDELRDAGLVRLVHPSHGARTVKYRQVAVEALGLDEPGRAVLTVLLLRGAQTSGELRARTDRLHPFAQADDVDRALGRLGQLSPALARPLPRRPGQKEVRWTQLLDGAGEDDAGRGADAQMVVGAPGPPEPPAPPTVEVPAEVAALGAFIGVWSGRGDGRYPTISPFAYTEEIELRPVPGKPLLAYRSSTRAADDGRTLHGESGFWRLVGPDQVELVVAQGAGLVETAEGVLDAGLATAEVIVSGTVSGTSTAKDVTATERRYRVEGERLSYEVAMAAVGQPLQHHLRAELTRR